MRQEGMDSGVRQGWSLPLTRPGNVEQIIYLLEMPKPSVQVGVRAFPLCKLFL